MADINSPVEIPVTTGPIRGGRKVHVGARTGSGVRVAMREILLEEGEEPVRVYDTSGPYTDPRANIDINAGLRVGHAVFAITAHAVPSLCPHAPDTAGWPQRPRARRSQSSRIKR